MKRSFDAFIFDLDGTLLDTLADLVILTNATLQQFGYPVRTEKEINSFIGDGLLVLLQRAAPPHLEEEQINLLLKRWKELYPHYGVAKTKEFPGISNVLAKLNAHGKKLGVLSNKFDKGVSDLIPLSFPGMFKVFRGVSEGIPRKPNPQGLLSVINELEVEPANVVYVGDSLVDIKVAHAAEVSSIGVTWGYQAKEELLKVKPYALIDTPEELLQFI